MRIASRHYTDDAHLAEIERRRAELPDSVEVLFEYACALEDLGREEAASQAYLGILQRDARHLGALINLGLMLMARDDITTARAFFTQASTHHPLSTIVHVNLGQALLEQGEIASAQAQYSAAPALDPDFFAAHHGLALLYERSGDARLAQAHLERAFEKRASWTLPYAGSAPPLRVLLLVSARGGDIVTHPFLDDRIVETTMFVPEGFRAGMTLPVHDVIFNGIGDADRCRTSLERAVAVLAASSAGVINAPERVLATGRAATSYRLRNIAGVRVPRTELLRRDAIEAENLTERGWSFPLLVRAPGYQGGRHFERVDEAAGLGAALARVPGDQLFAIEFVDTRDGDGYVRKYRVLFIGGRLLPVHLAISRDWKVHYFSADMNENAAHRAEEARFLNDAPGALGSTTIAKLEAIARELDLDYGGIDFGIDAGGKLVAFEANATMAVYPPALGEEWAYRRRAYDAVIAAVRAMIICRAGR